MTLAALPENTQHDVEWDAGQLGCGDLVLALRQRLRLAPGKVFKVTALDPGAPADIPAWCRMTNNALLAHDARSRVFWIRAKV